MKKKTTLDKFMVTHIAVKNTKMKTVRLPAGDEVHIPKLSYKHFVKMKTLTSPVDMINYIVNDIKPREVTTAEAEFMLIHLHYHNDAEAAKFLETEGISLDDLKITEARYEYDFDNIHISFRVPELFNDNLYALIQHATVDGKEVELTEEARFNLLNCLYRYEFDDVKNGVLQEVYIIHKGKTIKGLNIIGD